MKSLEDYIEDTERKVKNRDITSIKCLIKDLELKYDIEHCERIFESYTCDEKIVLEKYYLRTKAYDCVNKCRKLYEVTLKEVYSCMPPEAEVISAREIKE